MPILLLTGTFLFWVTAKGRLPQYIALFTTSAPSTSDATANAPTPGDAAVAFGNNIGKVGGITAGPGTITNPVIYALPNIVDWATDIAKHILEKPSQ